MAYDNGVEQNKQAIRDYIMRVYNSTEDYTQQELKPFKSNMTKQEILDAYYGSSTPSANEIPVLQPMNQHPIQAQTPTQKQNTPTTTQKPQKDVEMERAKEIGRQARLYAESGKLKPTERALSANEQRDMERAMNARKEAEDRRKKTVTETVKTEEQLSGEMPSEITSGTVNKRQTDLSTRNVMRNQYALADAIAQNAKEDYSIQSNRDDSNYVVPIEKYNELMKNPDLAKDINTLEKVIYNNADQDATVSPEWAETFGAKNITGGYTEDEFYDLLSDKYGLDRQQLSDMALTRHADITNRENEQYQKDLNRFGEKHPVLGSAFSLAGTIGSGTEGLVNTALGGITGDNRYASNMFNATKQAPREGVRERIDSNVGDTLYDLGMGVADMGAGAATGSAPAILAGNTANEAYLSALDRGSSARQAAAYAGASGAVDYITNKIGLDKAKSLALDSVKSAGIKRMLIQNGIAGLGEAGENVLQDIAQTIADEFINNKNSEMRTSYAAHIANGESENEALKNVFLEKAGQLAMSAGTGFAMGSAMQGIPTLANDINARIFMNDAENRSQRVWDRVNAWVNDRKNSLNPLEDAQNNIEVTDISDEFEPFNPLEMARENENIDNTARQQEQAIEEINRLQEPTEEVTPQNVNEIPEVTANPQSVTPETVNDIPNLEEANTFDDAALQSQLENRSAVDVKSVNAGNKELDSRLNTIVNMFGGNKDNSKVIDLKNALNDYAQTGSEDSLNTARQLAAELDNDYQGSTYTNRRGGTTDFANSMVGKFTDQVDAFADSLKANANVRGKKVSVPEIDTMINDIFSRYNLTEENANLIKRFKQAINNVIADPSDENWDDVIHYAGEVGKFSNELSEYLSTYRGQDRTRPFDRAVITDIMDAVEQYIYPDRNYSNPITFESRNNEPQPQAPGSVPPNTPNIPNMEEPDITSGENGQRRVITNTMKNAGIVSQDDINNNPVIQKMVEYEKHSNDKSVQQARQDVANDREGLEREYINGSKQIDSDIDVDRSMLILQDLVSDMDAGNDVTANMAKRDSIMRNAAENGTDAGQFIQAFAKYANTGVDALLKATKIQNEGVKNWVSRNQKADKTNRKLAEALKRQGYDGSMDNLPKERMDIETYRQQVRNTLAREFASIEDQFTDSDVDYLANLIEQGATTKELTDALNTKMATGNWGITAETQNKVNLLFEEARQHDENSREFVENQAEAFRLLANEVAPDASPLEKFEAWRYMAMLGNPKTMLRNYIGNKMFGAVVGVSNNLSAALEEGIDKAYYKKTGKHIQRTKAFINPVKDKDFIDAAKEDAFGKRFRQIERSKYEKPVKDAIMQQREVFDSKALQLYEKAVDAGISDTKAVVNKYATSMVGYLKANGYDQSILKAQSEYDNLKQLKKSGDFTDADAKRMEELQPTIDVLEKARDYALKQADYATFHEDNAVAEALTKASNYTRNSDNRIVRGLGYALEGTIPFKKTPANILRSAFEYSPFGALKSIAETGKLIYENTGDRKGNLADEYKKTGKISGKEKTVQRSLAADVIDSWSKTLTGTGLTALGYYLFNKGILTSSTNDEKYQDQLEKIGNYGININGHTYTLDWAAPGVMPLLLGAEINKVAKENAISDKEWYESPDRILETVNALLDPMMETSMLSGLKDTLQNAANEVRYNENNAMGGILGSIVGNTLTGYATQGIPTISGQIARTVDPIRRTTDTVNEGIVGAAEKQLRKAANKIPYLSMINPEYRDARGERQYNSPFQDEGVIPALGNLAYQMLSPGYYSKENTTAADQSARDTYNGLDEGNKPVRDPKVFADWKATKRINDEKLDPQQMQRYREIAGTTNNALREALAGAEWFNALPATDKTEILKRVNSLSDKIGQYNINPDSVTVQSEIKAFLDNQGGRYLNSGVRAVLDYMEAEYNPYGLSKDTYQEMKESGEDLSQYTGYGEALEQYGLTDTQANREAWKNGQEQSFAEIAEYNKAFTDAGMEKPYTSKSAQDAYESGDLETYKEYREYLDKKDLTDSEKRWSDFKSGKIDATASLNSDIDWNSYGITNKYADEGYAKAKQEIPHLLPQVYAQTYKAIDANGNNSFTQDEVINYMNRIGADEATGMQIWNGYGTSTWKKIPVLENGKWVKKSK